MKKLWNSFNFPSSHAVAHLSITARHSFLQVKRLPRRRRKVPGAVARGGGVCLHSISSRGNGAGRMLRVAPGAGSSSITLVSNHDLSEGVCRCVRGFKAQNLTPCSWKYVTQWTSHTSRLESWLNSADQVSNHDHSRERNKAKALRDS